MQTLITMNRFNNLKRVVLCLILTVFASFSCFSVALADEIQVYLGGYVLGFTVKTEGATVVSTCDVITENGIKSPCKDAGIIAGDVILSLNGVKVNGILEVNNQIIKSNCNVIVAEYLRLGEKRLCNITPVKDVNGVIKIGVFLRDDLSGLGTVTYYKPNGEFASLGHPITSEKGELVSVLTGNVFNASVIGVNKAVGLKAGELRGVFCGDKPIGKITKNTKVGLYGKIEKFKKIGYTLIECGKAVIGKAQIFSTVTGEEPKYYDIDIVKVERKNSQNKNIVIRVSDKELLSATGGILQGMSGSPIVQNGKLVGAVTHVFLNDSARGFGIDISNMLCE